MLQLEQCEERLQRRMNQSAAEPVELVLWTQAAVVVVVWVTVVTQPDQRVVLLVPTDQVVTDAVELDQSRMLVDQEVDENPLGWNPQALLVDAQVPLME